MNLSIGVCVLCINKTKVVIPPQAGKITDLLKGILEDHIDVQKFRETNDTLKVCTLCLHDILLLEEHRTKLGKFAEDLQKCSLCQSLDHLIVCQDWPHMNTLLESVNVRRQKKCSVCLQCIKYLELFNGIKGNFLKKYPHVALTSPRTKANIRRNKNDNTKSSLRINNKKDEASYSISPHLQSLKTKRSVKRALRHLTALKYSQYNTNKYSHDAKLWGQIPFVNLRRSDVSVSGPQPKRKDNHLLHKPFFKIRLKPSSNKTTANKIPLEDENHPKKSASIPIVEKDLIVKLPKIDIYKMQQKLINSDPKLNIFPSQTPTKGSRKFIYEDPLLSDKKRKSVTFADNLNEAMNKISGKSTSPLKSPLKKNSSYPLFSSSSSENSSDEDLTTVKNAIKNIAGNDSDDELDASKGYVTEIQKNNDNIFDCLKKSNSPQKRKSVICDIVEPEDVIKKRKTNDTEFDIRKDLNGIIDPNNVMEKNPLGLELEELERNDRKENDEKRQTESSETDKEKSGRDTICCIKAKISENSNVATNLEEMNERDVSTVQKISSSNVSYKLDASSDRTAEDLLMLTLNEFKKLKDHNGEQEDPTKSDDKLELIEHNNIRLDELNANAGYLSDKNENQESVRVPRIHFENELNGNTNLVSADQIGSDTTTPPLVISEKSHPEESEVHNEKNSENVETQSEILKT